MTHPDFTLLAALIVVATPGEAAHLTPLTGAFRERLRVQVTVSGVGPVAAALATQRALLAAPYALAISAGIGGAYPASGLAPGDLAVSSRIIQADLGAWDDGQFLDFTALGLSVLPGPLESPETHADPDVQAGHFPAWEKAAQVAARAGAQLGPLLTLGSVTGDHAAARHLQARHPGALTEGMEGAGVAHAALLAGVPSLEVRGVSNPVGPRDRAAWRIPQALAATRRGVEAALLTLLDD
ncbi:futalosine hydrolase [Deinococcus sp. RIT780]|uniref:futalosine hydrolase n=1 Tax=Deinococcus sp. RIT780 TaxID=2870472 RepID=UPI001C8A3832|nr:futalosine hydrolase [Deinococcus sp. RIT780]MBX8466745.1 futalosine hydrolase [Deinococcus sp. RIT780]